MTSSPYKKEELLKTLPKLPRTGRRKLSNHVLIGLTSDRSTCMSDRFVLIKRLRDQRYRPDPGFDLRKVNAFRRLVFTLDEKKQGFVRSLNTDLKGGEDYTVLMGVLGIAASAYSFGVGAVFALLTIAVAPGRERTAVLAREGDQIWHLEYVGQEDGKLKHCEQFLLVDPFRNSSNDEHSAWVIHEERQDLEIR